MRHSSRGGFRVYPHHLHVMSLMPSRTLKCLYWHLYKLECTYVQRFGLGDSAQMVVQPRLADHHPPEFNRRALRVLSKTSHAPKL